MSDLLSTILLESRLQPVFVLEDRLKPGLQQKTRYAKIPVTTSPFTSSRGWFRWLYTIVSGLMPTLVVDRRQQFRRVDRVLERRATPSCRTCRRRSRA